MYRFYFNSHRWKPTRDQWITANRCLPVEEIQRIEQYQFQRDVKHTLLGQLLIRYLLSRVFEQDSSTFLIQRSPSNRPFLQSTPTFDFNLSHQNELVCIAGTFDGRIGCDTMVYQEKPNEELFRKKFTTDEWKFIERNPRNFSRLWCLKESYVKWLGVGMGFSLLKLNFHLQTLEFLPTKALISDTRLTIADDRLSPNDDLRFDEQMISLSANAPSQLITVCLSTKNPSRAFVELNIDDILHGCTPFPRNKEDHLLSWERFQMKKTNR